MKEYLRHWRKAAPFAVVALLAVMFAGAGAWSIHATGTSEFCMICHEMKVLGEHGWMHSAHFQNQKGVVAGCGDCHITPEFPHMLWVKARDGSKDIFMHFFGESDPYRMDWTELGVAARRKISDASCRKCHQNLTEKGAPIKQIIAHRAYLRLDGAKKCLDCHREQFHGGYRDYLSIGETNDTNETITEGGDS